MKISTAPKWTVRHQGLARRCNRGFRNPAKKKKIAFVVAQGIGVGVATLSGLPAAPAAGQVADPGETSGEAVERIIVSGSLTPRAETEIGAAIEVIDASDIVERQTVNLSDVLRDVAGVEVNRSGPVGALTQVRIRGAEANHTYVLIDGIEASNPFNGEFNFADLLAFGVERVEVIRGAQSALHGSDALAGVIAVVTKDGNDGGLAEAEAQVGSFGTEQFAASIGGGDARLNGRATVISYDTNGVNTSRFGREEDSYENLTVHAKGAFEASDALRLTGVLRYVDSHTESDDQDFDAFSPTQGLVIDSDAAAGNEFLFAHGAVESRHLDGALRSKAAFGFTRAETDNFASDAFIGGNRGARYKVEAQSTYSWAANVYEGAFTAAYQHEHLDFKNIGFSQADPSNQQQTDNQDSFIGELNVSVFDAAHLSGAIRHDFNDRFADVTSYRAAASVEFRTLGGRLHASYGKGVTNPGFFELFGFIPDTFQGDPDLQPEHATSFDVGWTQNLPLGARFDATFFRSILRDEIFTTFAFDANSGQFISTPLNQDGESRRKGVETALSGRLSEDLSYEARYTYLDADEPDGAREVRRPQHVASFNLGYQFADGRGSANLGLRYNGAQEDLEFIFATPETRVRLESYLLMNFAASYRLNDRLEVFARGENILDADYEEVFGFQSPGVGFFGGVRLTY